MRALTDDTIKALTGWAQHHAAMFTADRQDGPEVNRRVDHGAGEYTGIKLRQFSRDWIMLQFHNFTFKDEFEFIVARFRALLGPEPLAEFERRLAEFPPRSDEAFARLLDEKCPAGYQPKEA